MLIAHIADVHLGKQQYGLEYREQDVYNLFDEAVTIALDEHVDAVIISGDLFDEYRPRVNALRTAIMQLRRLEEKGVPAIIIPGDHDMPKRRDRIILEILSDILDNVYFLGYFGPDKKPVSAKVFEGMKLAIYALPFIPFRHGNRRIINRLLVDAESFFRRYGGYKHVLVAHYSVDEVHPFDAMLSLSNIPKVDYAAFGHVHDRVKLYLPKGGVFSYPGSIDIYRSSEINSWIERGKGFNIIDLSSETDLSSIHFINLAVRPQYRYDIRLDDLERVVADVRDRLRKASKKPIIVHVNVRIPPGAVVNPKQRLSTIFSDKDVYFRISTSIERREEAVVSEPQLDEEEILAKYIGAPREVAREILELVNRLSEKEYTAKEIYSILKEIYEKWFKNKKIVFKPKTRKTIKIAGRPLGKVDLFEYFKRG